MKPAEMFRELMIIHTHIEKTGGTSVVQAMKEWFGDRVHDLRPADAKHPKEMVAAEKSKIWVLSGHFHSGQMDRFFGRPAAYICCVREPGERFQSYIKYVQRGKNHPALETFGGMTTLEAAKHAIEINHHSVTNPMTRTTAQADYSVMCPLPRLDEFTRRLAVAFGKEPKEFRSNVNPKNKDLDEEAAALIREANSKDCELYDNAVGAFDDWLAKGEDLKDLFKASRKKNLNRA